MTTYQVPTDGQLKTWAAELNEGAQAGRCYYVLNRSAYPVESVRLTADGWFAPRVNGVELLSVHSSELETYFRLTHSFRVAATPYQPLQRSVA